MINEGRPVFVDSPSVRIGSGPWARLLASAVVGDEGSSRAERGRILARTGHVHSVSVREGEISARVIGSGDAEYVVTLATPLLSRRVWAAATGSAHRGHAAAARGLEQSVGLEHELATVWDAPLVAPGRAIRRSCTCVDGARVGTCKHVMALAYVVADAIDRDPSVLLRWRGCRTLENETGAEERAPVLQPPGDPWEAGPLPAAAEVRPLPPGAVLKRLGQSGLTVGTRDLAEVLQPAYAAFAAASQD